MSFHNRIQEGTHNRERRKPYYDARAFSSHCKSGACSYCRQGKQYTNIKRVQSATDKIRDYHKDPIWYYDRGSDCTYHTFTYWSDRDEPYVDPDIDMMVELEQLEKYILNGSWIIIE